MIGPRTTKVGGESAKSGNVQLQRRQLNLNRYYARHPSLLLSNDCGHPSSSSSTVVLPGNDESTNVPLTAGPPTTVVTSSGEHKSSNAAQNLNLARHTYANSVNLRNSMKRGRSTGNLHNSVSGTGAVVSRSNPRRGYSSSPTKRREEKRWYDTFGVNKGAGPSFGSSSILGGPGLRAGGVSKAREQHLNKLKTLKQNIKDIKSTTNQISSKTQFRPSTRSMTSFQTAQSSLQTHANSVQTVPGSMHTANSQNGHSLHYMHGTNSLQSGMQSGMQNDVNSMRSRATNSLAQTISGGNRSLTNSQHLNASQLHATQLLNSLQQQVSQSQMLNSSQQSHQQLNQSQHLSQSQQLSQSQMMNNSISIMNPTNFVATNSTQSLVVTESLGDHIRGTSLQQTNSQPQGLQIPSKQLQEQQQILSKQLQEQQEEKSSTSSTSDPNNIQEHPKSAPKKESTSSSEPGKTVEKSVEHLTLIDKKLDMKLRMYRNLFDEVIRRDLAFGPLLAKIKSTYETLLSTEITDIGEHPPSSFHEKIRRKIHFLNKESDMISAKLSVMDSEILTIQEDEQRIRQQLISVGWEGA